MHPPVLIMAPTVPAVTVDDAKTFLGADGDDALITRLVAAALGKLEGWRGILGRVLAEQTWRQDFDRFERCMVIPLGPVISITGITWTDSSGQTKTVDESDYDHVTDDGGYEIVRFADGYDLPTDLVRSKAVSVTYQAGWATVDGKSTVPEELTTAILFMVKDMYASAAADGGLRSFEVTGAFVEQYNNPQIVSQNTMRIVGSLIGDYRRYVL